MLTIDPGLKAYQTLCAWASGSLDIVYGSNFILYYHLQKKKKMKRMNENCEQEIAKQERDYEASYEMN
jgi:hypothetical protein